MTEAEPSNDGAAPGDVHQVAATAVEMATSPGPIVRGLRWGEGNETVLLLHEAGRDLDAWADLPAHLLAPGVAVVALDLPGHGLSDGPWQAAALPAEVQAVLAQLRIEGTTRLCLVAAGDSATACLVAAAGDRVDRLVLLSPALPDAAALPDPRAVRAAKLILVGAHDATHVAAARAVYDRCAGWSVSCSLPTTAQGTDLLDGSVGQQAREHIAGFLRDGRVPPRRKGDP